MNRTYAAKRLLEHGELTLDELADITKWTREQCSKTMSHLSDQGIVYMPERGLYRLTDDTESMLDDDMYRLRGCTRNGGALAPVQPALFDVWRAPVVDDSEVARLQGEQGKPREDGACVLGDFRTRQSPVVIPGWRRRAAAARARIEAQAFPEGVAA